MRPRTLLIGGAALVASVAIAIAFVVSRDDESSPENGRSLEARVSGIALRIADIEYSSTSTTVHLEIEHPILKTNRLGSLFLLNPADLRVTGFVSGVEGGFVIHRPTDGVDRRELRLGAVEDVRQPVSLRIERLCVGRNEQDPSCDWREGPWVIEWKPDVSAEDPIDRRIAVNQEQTAQGITVRIHEVRLASTEMVITASFHGTLPDGQQVFTGSLRMPSPGGKPLPGEGGGGSSSDPPGQTKTFRFPAPSQGIREIVIDAEVDYQQGTLEGLWRFTIPLP